MIHYLPMKRQFFASRKRNVKGLMHQKHLVNHLELRIEVEITLSINQVMLFLVQSLFYILYHQMILTETQLISKLNRLFFMRKGKIYFNCLTFDIIKFAKEGINILYE